MIVQAQVTIVTRLALLAILIPVNALAQTAATTATVSPRTFWDVDAALAGTFTPIGGNTSVGRGASVSLAVVPAKQDGEYAYGIGVVGAFTKVWSNQSANVSHRESWVLGGVQLDALAEVRISIQVLGGLKRVAVAGHSETHAAVGVGTTWTLPVTTTVGIRVVDFSWLATPGDPLSTHRCALAFGIDVFPLGYFGR